MTFGASLLRRPIAVGVFFGTVCLLGAATLFVMPVDLLPDIQVPRYLVRCLAPGINAETLERTVTLPMEAALRGIGGLKRTASVTRDGVSVISAEFVWSSDPEAVLLEIRERTERMAALLPSGVRRPSVLRVDPNEDPILSVAVAPRAQEDGAGGETERLAGISELASGVLRRRLELVEGVGMVGLAGVRTREIRINADAAKLVASGLVPGDLLVAVRSSVADLQAGETVRSGTRYQVIVATESPGVPALRDLLLRGSEGAPAVRLGDVAQVEWSVSEPAGRIRVGGREVVELRIIKDPPANAIATAERVQDEVQRLQREFPGLELSVVSDRTAYIRRTAADVIEAGLLGAGLSFGIFFLVLRNWRDPLVVGVSYPVSVLATLFIVHLLGIHLNVISLAGLALGIGMLGDNAVIVVENIRRSAERGLPVRRAVLEGAARVGVPAAVSTATNVAVFLPVLTLDGVGRQLFGQMAVAMTVSLLISLLVATTLVPVLVDRLPWRAGLRTRTVPWGSQTLWLTNVLGWAIRRRIVVVGIAASLMIAGMFYAAFLPAGGTPVMDESSLTVTLDFPPATPQNELLDHVLSFERQLLTLRGVQSLRLESGTPEESDSWAAEGSSATRVVASIESGAGVDIRTLQDRIRSWTRMMEGQVAGLRTAVGPRATPFDRLMEFGNRGIAVRFTGLQESDWSRLSPEILDAVASVRGITDISRNGAALVDEQVILPDPEAATRHGVPLPSVEAAIASFHSGAFLIPYEGGELPVHLRVGHHPLRSNAETILRGRISVHRRILEMRSLVHAGWRPNLADLCREDGRRVFLVKANAADRAPADVVSDLATVLARVALPPGAAVRVGVLSREASDSAGSAVLAVFLSVLLMYMILAAEYESLILPLIVLASSPLAFVGAVAALAFWGEPLGILSLAGLIITVGAVDNDAVIALDLIAEKIRAGKDTSRAIIEGMQERLRPIVVTSLTTVLGVLPLLFRSGNGSVLVRSLAIPLAGGLIASTVATLLVIPSLIAIAGDRLHLLPRAGSGRQR